MKAFSNFIAPAWAILESPLSSIFICRLWCLSACLCLLLTLVRVCVYSPSCLIFPHSLLAFIIMKLLKQLQPSQQEPVGQLLFHTRCFVFITYVLLCSAALQSLLCLSHVELGWTKAWCKGCCLVGLVESGILLKVTSKWWRWRCGGVSRGFDGVMDWCHSGQTCLAEVMISSRWWKRHNSNLF